MDVLARNRAGELTQRADGLTPNAGGGVTELAGDAAEARECTVEST